MLAEKRMLKGGANAASTGSALPLLTAANNARMRPRTMA
jgi:hypothetical protein